MVTFGKCKNCIQKLVRLLRVYKRNMLNMLEQKPKASRI